MFTIPRESPEIPLVKSEDLMIFISRHRNRPESVVGDGGVLFLNLSGEIIRIASRLYFVFKVGEPKKGIADDIRPIWIFEGIDEPGVEVLNSFLEATIGRYNFAVTRNDVDGSRILELNLFTALVNIFKKHLDALSWPTEEEADEYVQRLKEEEEYR